jgi:inner membrane protein
MTAPNHLAGGFAITGVVTALCGINILEERELLVTVALASVLPDIDYTKSIIGKCFYPIARFIQRHYGHRTITHSLLALIFLTALVGLVQSSFTPQGHYASVFAVAYGSHLLLDACTKQGIPLLYPFKRNPFVVPGNPDLRFETANARHETLAFCFFIACGLTMRPLMANGFWTSYNSLFGTLKHIVSEFHRADDLIHVDFEIQKGSVTRRQKGFVLAVNEQKMTIIDRDKNFYTVPSEDEIIRDIIPDHTGLIFSYLKGDFTNISPDSLIHFIRTCECTAIDIQANNPFLWIHDNIEESKTRLSLTYPNDLYIKEVELEKENAKYIVDPAIKAIQDEIKLTKQAFEEDMARYQQDLLRYNNLKYLAEKEDMPVRKEMLMEEFATLKFPKMPNPIDDRIEKLNIRIRTHRDRDQQQYQARIDQQKKSHGPLTFSGTYQKLLVNGKDI